MLVNELRLFLYGSVNDALIDVYCKMISLFTDKNVFTSYYYLMELIATRDQYEKQTWIHKINDILAAQADAVLADFSITLSDEITIPETLTVLEGLFLLEDWEDKARLTDIVNAASNNVECFCDLISEVTTVPPEYMLGWIKSVSAEFIENVAVVNKDNTVEENILLPDDPELYNNVKKKIKIYIANHKDHTKIETLITSGIRLLTPFSELLGHYIEKGWIDFNKLQNTPLSSTALRKLVEPLAYEIVGLGIMSGENNIAFSETFAKTIVQYSVPDIIAMEWISQVKDIAMRIN